MGQAHLATIYGMVQASSSTFRPSFQEGRDAEILEQYKRDVIDLVEALGLDIVSVEPFLLRQFMLMERKGGYRKPMRQVDDETYEDDDGSLWRVSSATDKEIL